MKELQVGILGVGRIANTFHIPSWMEQPNCRIRALCDENGETLEGAGRKWGVGHLFSDYRDMLRVPELDIVTVCTPTAVHYRHAMAALQAGKHVLVEKPIASCPEDADRLAVAARRLRLTLMCAQHQRFRTATGVARRLIASGRIGDIYYARTRSISRRYVPVPGSFVQRKRSGGGVVLDQGAHLVDLAWWLMGFPVPKRAFGRIQRRLARSREIARQCGGWTPASFNVEEWGSGMIDFAGGRVMSLEVSYLLNQPEDDFSVQFCGTQGGLLWPQLVLTDSQGRSQQVRMGVDRLASRLQVAHFVSCVRAESTPLVDPKQSAEVVRMLDAVYRSARKGCAVNVHSS